jgi:hypothetical protein
MYLQYLLIIDCTVCVLFLNTVLLQTGRCVQLIIVLLRTCITCVAVHTRYALSYTKKGYTHLQTGIRT